MSVLTIFIHYSKGSPSHGNQRKRNKRQPFGMKVKLSLHADTMIFSIKPPPKEYIKKLIELLNEFTKVAEHKTII